MTSFPGFEEHHAANRRWPQFNRLIAAASEIDLEVELVAGDQVYEEKTPRQRRDLVGMRLTLDGETFARQDIVDGDLDAAALAIAPALLRGQERP